MAAVRVGPVAVASRRVALLAALVTSSASFAAPFEDSIAQRTLACTGCHGPQGRAASDGYYPRIAGKPAGYLFNQLVNFRDGRRRYELMAHLVAPLTDAFLQEIADHFASLEVAYLPPARATDAPGSMSRGEQLALRGDPALQVPACSQCHGDGLMGLVPAIPGLKGLPRDYLNAQLGAWRGGQRQARAPDCMATIAKRLAPTDIGAVSAWLSSQTVPPGAKPAQALNAPLPIECGGVSSGPR